MHKGLKRLEELEPSFREKVEELLNKLDDFGVPVLIVSARRSMQQQKQLYDQGRSLPGKIVTNAKPGSSAHNFGMAVDLCPLNAKGEADWNDDKGFVKIATLAEDMGLVSGRFFRTIFDAPHVEASNWRAAQAEWKAGRLNIP